MKNDISQALLDRPVCAFDLETVPDEGFGRGHWGLKGSDLDVQDAMQARRLEETDGRTDFLPVHLHRIVTLSVVWWQIGRDGKHKIRISSLGDGSTDENHILREFVDKLLPRRPRLISWNGQGFDLPVLHYRMMRNRIQAPSYWQPRNKWDDYQKRFSSEHIDLMDVLGNFKSPVKLDEAAQLCGFPGKVVTEGHRVFQHIARGEVELVQGYCEMDALNTLLLFARWCLTRGELDETAEKAFNQAVLAALDTAPDRPGWQEVALALRQS